jgi:predicted small lipoprotein YifL
MSKFVRIVLVAFALMGLAACGSSSPNDGGTDTGATE